MFLVFFFFFQAEDGIRDADVTGVQTCALPISLSAVVARQRGRGRLRSATVALGAASLVAAGAIAYTLPSGVAHTTAATAGAATAAGGSTAHATSGGSGVATTTSSGTGS